MADSYRPNIRGGNAGRDYRRVPPPTQPRNPLPLEARMTYSGDSYRPSQNQRSAPRPGNAHQPRDRRNNDAHSSRSGFQGDFTFRSNHQAPQFTADNGGYSRAPLPPHRRRPTAPHERPLLRSRSETTPEQLLGVTDGSARFLNPDDVSETEAEMDMGSDVDDSTAFFNANGVSPPEDGEVSNHKKTRVEGQFKAGANSVPQWSNPDPYTVLPPMDDTQAKKKDVVQLIRKAKLSQSGAASTSNPVADNDDFISLNFEDDVVAASDDKHYRTSGWCTVSSGASTPSGINGGHTASENKHSESVAIAVSPIPPSPPPNPTPPPPVMPPVMHWSQIKSYLVAQNFSPYHFSASNNVASNLSAQYAPHSYPTVSNHPIDHQSINNTSVFSQPSRNDSVSQPLNLTESSCIPVDAANENRTANEYHTARGKQRARENHTAGSLNEVTSAGLLNRSTEPPTPQSAAGGKRRRGNDDADPRAQSRRNLKRQREDEVGISPEWLPKPNRTATPWCTADGSRISATDMKDRLHKEISDFYDFVKPLGFEGSARNSLIDRISAAVKVRFPDSTIYCFGSFAAGLYLPTADMDLVLVSHRFDRGGSKVYDTTGRGKKFLYLMAQLLNDKRIAEVNSVQVIPRAKVPIVKFTDQQTGLRVDISFEKLDGLETQRTFAAWKIQYPTMPVLVSLVKQFLLMRGMNEVMTGGLGGYTSICLVVSMLQHLKPTQHNLGELLLEFLDLYGNRFDLDTTTIYMDPPGFRIKGEFGVDGRSEKPGQLSIVDPTNSHNNISGGSHKVADVFKLFSEAYKTIQDRIALARIDPTKVTSILEPLLGGDYSSYMDQRERLREISGESKRSHFKSNRNN